MKNLLKARSRLKTCLLLVVAAIISGCPSVSDDAPAATKAAESAAAKAQRGEASPEGLRGLSGAPESGDDAVGQEPAQVPPAQGQSAIPGQGKPWWGAGSDPHRQNYSPYNGPQRAALQWSCAVGGRFCSRLALIEETIVAGLTQAGTRPGFEPCEERYAIDSEELPGQVAGGGVVGVSTAGEVAWRRQTSGSPLICAARIPDPRVYAHCWWRRFEDVRGRGDVPETLVMLKSELAAISPDGDELWALEAEGSMLGDPLLTADGAVYTIAVRRENVFHDKYYDHSLTKASLVCYDPAGKERWQYRLSQFEDCWELTPASQICLLRLGSIGFCWNDHTFHAIKSDGGKDWTYGLLSVPDGPTAASPAGDVVILANDRPELSDKQLDLMNWEAMNKYGVLHVLRGVGSLRWELQPGSDVHSAVAIDAAGAIRFGSTLYEHDREHLAEMGRIYALSADKQLLWQYDTRAPFEDTPLQPDPLVDAAGVLYIADAGKHLYALNADGTLKWEYAAPKGFATNPVIAPDGTLYIGGNDGKLYALGDESSR